METSGKKGWNRSAATSAPPPRRDARRGIIFCLCILVSLVCFVILGVWLWSGGGEAETRRPTVAKPAKIVEVAPKPVATNVTRGMDVPERKAYKDLSNAEKLKYFRDKYGDDIPDNLKPIVYYLENPPTKNFKKKPDKASIFKYRSEREIASFLLVKPGTWMMRPTTFGAKFDVDLIQSMQDKIEIKAGDSEEQRQLKEAVIAAKEELMDLAKAGEDPSKVMTEFAKDLYQMGQYRRDLESEIRAIKNDPSKSDDELSLAVEAANKMLEKKGLKPLRQPNMLIRNANLRLAGERKKMSSKKGAAEK